MSKQAPTPLEIDSRGKHFFERDPRHYVILGDVAGSQVGVIADTLNCHYCLSSDDQRQYLERLVHRYNAHEQMLAALKAIADGLQITNPDAYEIARAAIAKATGVTQ